MQHFVEEITIRNIRLLWPIIISWVNDEITNLIAGRTHGKSARVCQTRFPKSCKYQGNTPSSAIDTVLEVDGAILIAKGHDTSWRKSAMGMCFVALRDRLQLGQGQRRFQEEKTNIKQECMDVNLYSNADPDIQLITKFTR